MRFGPNVLAGFILAPVNLPNMNARTATVSPTKEAIAKRFSVLETINNIDAISMNVMKISIPAAVAIVISFETTVGPTGPIK